MASVLWTGQWPPVILALSYGRKPQDIYSGTLHAWGFPRMRTAAFPLAAVSNRVVLWKQILEVESTGTCTILSIIWTGKRMLNVTSMRSPSAFRWDALTDTLDRYGIQYLGASRPYFAAFGLYSAAVLGGTALYQLGKGLTSYFLAGPLALGKNVREYGEWAVVTGANDGIGKQYCMELARRGMNIVLVSHHEEKTHAAAKEIESQFRCKTKVIVADFRQNDLALYTSIQAQLTGLRIGILVNNVGQAGGNPELFLENPPEAQNCLDIVSVNVTSYVMMTRIVLPGMITRGKGIIVMISSVNGDIPTPRAALYSGTKAFDDFFARALYDEYKEKGIVVQSVMPGPVDTKMVQEEHRKTWWCVSTEAFVPPAINQIGLRTRTYGHWKHALNMKLRKTLPGWQWLL